MSDRADRVLVTRLDNAGDVLLTGPAVRAVAAHAEVSFLAGPKGAAAAELLPGVEQVLRFACPWIDADAPPVDSRSLQALVAIVRKGGFSAAAIFGSSHQSPLPTALALRLAGIATIAAVSHEYPGSLLDHRLRGDPDLHEVERHLAVVEMLGYRLAPGDDGGLALDPTRVVPAPARRPYLVVHPGASVPARTLAPARWVEVVAALVAAGNEVVVTGGRSEVALARAVAGPHGQVHAGEQSLAALAGLLAGAEAVVCGNTGPMHLAAAVGTPVVAVFAPTVPAQRWRPWRVPHVLLGDLTVACAECRARICPLPHQVCLDPVSPPAVVRAVAELTSQRRVSAPVSTPG